MKFQPRPYQTQAIAMGMNTLRMALLLDVGLGKTSVAATIMCNTLDTVEIDKWLVVAPLKVCQTTWPAEFKKWDHLQGVRVMRLDGQPTDERRRRLGRLKYADVVVINHDLLKWLVDELKGEWPFAGVVIDESSKYKDPSTKRFKSLRRVVGSITRILLLTGSPVAQGLLGLWPQMFLVDFGKRLGRTMNAYQQNYFTTSGYHGYKMVPLDGDREEIEEKIKDVCLTMRAADHLNMPPLIENQIDVILPPDAMKTYKKMERDMFLEIGDAPIVAVNSAVLTNKLSQIANGSAYGQLGDSGDLTDRVTVHLHDAKLDALEDFVDERNGAPFLLAYHYTSDKERIAKRLGKSLEFFDGTPDQLRRWKNMQIPVLALQPQSAGHGVDQLQHGTCTVLWYGPTWSRELYDQVNGRVIGARQIGTIFEKEPGMVHVLIARGTVDEGAKVALTERGINQTAFLNALKENVLWNRPSPLSGQNDNVITTGGL